MTLYLGFEHSGSAPNSDPIPGFVSRRRSVIFLFRYSGITAIGSGVRKRWRCEKWCDKHKVHNPEMIDRHMYAKLFFPKKWIARLFNYSSYVNEIGFSEKATLRVSGFMRNICRLYCSWPMAEQTIDEVDRLAISDKRLNISRDSLAPRKSMYK